MGKRSRLWRAAIVRPAPGRKPDAASLPACMLRGKVVEQRGDGVSGERSLEQLGLGEAVALPTQWPLGGLLELVVRDAELGLQAAGVAVGKLPAVLGLRIGLGTCGEPVEQVPGITGASDHSADDLD